MRALTLKELGKPAVVHDAVTPLAGEGEAVVALRAAALNHRELWIARGQYPGMTLPATMGCDGAGIVESVGAGVDPAMIGKPVVLYPGIGWGDDPRFPAAAFGLLGMPGPGTIADRIAVAASNIFAMPAHLDFASAAALPLAGLTAWRGLTTKAGLRAGERILITGIGGGVAAQALVLAKAMGAEVWVTSSSDETIAWAVAQGAAGGVNYKSEGWGKVLAKTAGPIDVAFDGAPAGGYPAYGRVLAMGARVVIYGSTGGMTFPASATELFLKNITITGSNVGNADEFAQMLKFVEAHRIAPMIERRFPLDQAVEALGYLETSHALGKVVIDVTEN